jgi:hypothetical protein
VLLLTLGTRITPWMSGSWPESRYIARPYAWNIHVAEEIALLAGMKGDRRCGTNHASCGIPCTTMRQTGPSLRGTAHLACPMKQDEEIGDGKGPPILFCRQAILSACLCANDIFPDRKTRVLQDWPEASNWYGERNSRNKICMLSWPHVVNKHLRCARCWESMKE